MVLEKFSNHKVRVYGKRADQSGNNWLADTLTPFRAISGNGVYGADPGDEAKVVGSGDTPIFSLPGDSHFRFMHLSPVSFSNCTKYRIRIIWGTGTMSDAIAAEQYTVESFTAKEFGVADKTITAFTKISVAMPFVRKGTKMWVQVKCPTDNAWFEFFAALCEYF